MSVSKVSDTGSHGAAWGVFSFRHRDKITCTILPTPIQSVQGKKEFGEG